MTRLDIFSEDVFNKPQSISSQATNINSKFSVHFPYSTKNSTF